MEDDTIFILYEKREDEGAFNFANDKLEDWKEKMRNASDDLFCFIGQRVHPHSQGELEKLIDKYTEAKDACSGIRHKLIYKAGVLDGMNLMSKPIQLKN